MQDCLLLHLELLERKNLYQKNFSENDSVKKYAHGRGLTQEILSTFKIGYSGEYGLNVSMFSGFNQKELIDMASDRAPFIDQSQSMNIYMSNPTLSKITSSHFHSWEKGLKTLCYYVRTRAISTGAKHLAVDISKKEKPKTTPEPVKVDYSYMNLPPKPNDSDFDCFGCSS